MNCLVVFISATFRKHVHSLHNTSHHNNWKLILKTTYLWYNYKLILKTTYFVFTSSVYKTVKLKMLHLLLPIVIFWCRSLKWSFIYMTMAQHMSSTPHYARAPSSTYFTPAPAIIIFWCWIMSRIFAQAQETIISSLSGQSKVNRRKLRSILKTEERTATLWLSTGYMPSKYCKIWGDYNSTRGVRFHLWNVSIRFQHEWKKNICSNISFSFIFC